jgi:hypothetical protein
MMMADVPISCESVDATRILPGLYMGGAPTPGHEVYACGFPVLVLCAKEYQPEARWFPRVRVVHCPLDDAELSSTEAALATSAAEMVVLARSRGARVLVTCWMGRNRSGLVTALALRSISNWSVPRIVKRVRERRPNALSNPSFLRFLGRR